MKVGFDHSQDKKEGPHGLLLLNQDEKDALRTVDMDIADEIGGTHDFIQKRDQELIEKARPDYSKMQRPKPSSKLSP